MSKVMYVTSLIEAAEGRGALVEYVDLVKFSNVLVGYLAWLKERESD